MIQMSEKIKIKFVSLWMELKGIMLSELCQRKRRINPRWMINIVFTHLWNIKYKTKMDSTE